MFILQKAIDNLRIVRNKLLYRLSEDEVVPIELITTGCCKMHLG